MGKIKGGKGNMCVFAWEKSDFSVEPARERERKGEKKRHCTEKARVTWYILNAIEASRLKARFSVDAIPPCLPSS